MLAFKIMDDPFVGTITFCRVYSGKIESGTTVLNSTKDKQERVGRMLLMHANNREDIKEAFAGDIVALAGLKDTRTGDTLCDTAEAGDPREDGVPGAGHRDRDRAEVEGRPGETRRRAGEARRRGPSFRVSTDPESGQTILKGMGELHLDIKVDILKRTYKVDANIGAPQVAYREKLTKKTEIDYTHKKQSGGSASSPRSRSCSSRPSRARARRSNRRSSAARCRRNTSPASKRASRACSAPACSPASPSSTSRRR